MDQTHICCVSCIGIHVGVDYMESRRERSCYNDLQFGVWKGIAFGTQSEAPKAKAGSLGEKTGAELVAGQTHTRWELVTSLGAPSY